MRACLLTLSVLVPALLLFSSPASAATSATLPAASKEPVDFKKHIQPIFESRCLECHDAKKHKGGMRLDRLDDLLTGGDSGKVGVILGKSAESYLVHVVAGLDPDAAMPPKGERLTSEQIGLLRGWIDQGAVWPADAAMVQKPHWAYVKPQRPPEPKLSSSDRRWTKNPVDAFVVDRLRREKLKPSPEADRAQLLRRVSLDLVGLPPSPEEVAAFEKDRSKDAYERAVDRLLASPRHGERWARPWLDLARYADTQGYEKDNRRSMWPYRDWVINALNRDLPFDRFSVEQLAGDLLPDATQDQKVATGFHRNTMTNTEGGTDNEEFRYEAVVDRVNTTYAVWMGTTISCAQCHNHKYDPFTMTDYYRTMAFLNSTEDADSDDEKPTMKVFAAGQEQAMADLRSKQSIAEKALTDAVKSEAFTRDRANWEQRTAAILAKWEPIEVIGATADNGTTLTNLGSGEILAKGDVRETESYTIRGKAGVKTITGFRLEALPDNSLPGKGPGRAQGNFILTEFKITVGGKPVNLVHAGADFSQPSYPVGNAIDGKDQTGWAVGSELGKRHLAVFGLESPLAVDGATEITFRLEHQNKEFTKHSLGRFRLSATSSATVTNVALPEEIQKLLTMAPEARDAKQSTRLSEFYRDRSPVTKTFVADAAKAKKAADDFYSAIPITSVMAELRTPRKTNRHIRGSFLNKGEEVTPGTPSSLHGFPEGQATNRLGFAEWIVSTNNPLTARVTVNRIWESYFGRGIVETTEDFGTMSEKPTHPELLEWLAMEFMHPTIQGPDGRLAQSWSLKHIHALIVSSATYRQTSKVTPALFEKDQFNRLFARGPRIRLEAEAIRDQALTVAGLLSTKMGGPSVMPPQPEGIWQMVYSGDQWKTPKTEDRYRRGLYTFWRRTSPYPSMITFDAPSREFCVLRRVRSNTPLQALTLLNDPVYIEAAQALGRRVLAEKPKASDRERIEHAFRLAVARKPTREEASRIGALLEAKRAEFAADLKSAETFATSQLGKLPEGLAPTEAAAWTVVANVLLNLDELITKG